MIIIVDSDGFIGSLDPQDQHFTASTQILSKLVKKSAKLIYPATVIVETVTFFQGRLNNPRLAQQVVELVTNKELTIEAVDGEILQKASSFMDFRRSKHDTFFDAVVVAIAEKYRADAIFSFDKFYKSKGFKLASEI